MWRKLYICPNPNCGKSFKTDELEFVRCPYCGTKVLFKQTPPTAKKVSTD